MHNINLSKYNLRTDLIIENDPILHEEKTEGNLTITKTKKSGNYITISFNDITDKDNEKEIENITSKLIKEIIVKNKIESNASCLVIGLGNLKSTPDSLGPKVLDNITITAHLFKVSKVDNTYRKVYAYKPDVMASTGIESATSIKAIIEAIKPDFIIAIDALASRKLERINKTIQITDTGIHPGSGIGNNRHEISKKTIGIPVIAIGIPTVVISSTIVYDTIEYLIKHISYLKSHENTSKLTIKRTNYKQKLMHNELTKEEKESLLGLIGSLNELDSRNLINEVLDNTELNLIVTPTEIDFLIDKLSKIIASSINKALLKDIY